MPITNWSLYDDEPTTGRFNVWADTSSITIDNGRESRTLFHEDELTINYDAERYKYKVIYMNGVWEFIPEGEIEKRKLTDIIGEPDWVV